MQRVSQIAVMHQHISEKLDLQEAALNEKETQLRKALEQGLQACAAERETVRQRRELLTQAIQLYHDYADNDYGDNALEPVQVAPALLAAKSSTDSAGSAPAPAQAAPMEPDASHPLAEMRSELSRAIQATMRDDDEEEPKRRWPSVWRSERN